jgi:hypothetical protein
MRRFHRGAALAALSTAALFIVQAPASPQGKAPAIEVRTVKYDGLAEEVAKNRGKVVLVDFWGTY